MNCPYCDAEFFYEDALDFEMDYNTVNVKVLSTCENCKKDFIYHEYYIFSNENDLEEVN